MTGESFEPLRQTYGRGFEGLIVGDTTISDIDGVMGRLFIRGYDVEELARHASFEEVSYLVLHGELPDRKTLEEWRKELVRWREAPPAAMEVLNYLPSRSHPLAQYRTALAVASCHIPEAERTDERAQWRRPARLLSWSSTLASAAIRHMRDLPPVPSRDDLSFAANFLWQTLEREPTPDEIRAFEVSLIVQVEHGLHAAAFAALTVFSTGTDLGSAVVAGMGALSGKLHGGANQTAFQMLQALDSLEEPREWIRSKVQENSRFPGFGHRVYKSADPRARILRPYARRLLAKRGLTHFWNTYQMLKEEVENRLGPKGIFANVDSITGLIYYPIGLPVEAFPIPFCLAIQTGWMAHCLEYLRGGRVIEPGAIYIGDTSQAFKSRPMIDEESMEADNAEER